MTLTTRINFKPISAHIFKGFRRILWIKNCYCGLKTVIDFILLYTSLLYLKAGAAVTQKHCYLKELTA